MATHNIFKTVHTASVVAVIAVAMLAPVTSSAQSEAPKLDRVLHNRAGELEGRSRVIVEFKRRADARSITQQGGRALGQLADATSQVADVENQSLAALAADPRVSRVLADRPAFATMERTGAAIGLAAARGTSRFTGKGIGVAVIDSGITAWHDDLYAHDGRAGSGNRVVHFKDFTRPVNPRVWTSDAVSDDYGHGTHVAGIIAGSGYDSDGRRSGIAPDAHLIGLKVLDAEGHGYISEVIAAIDYAVKMKSRFNIRVINLSVASGVFESYQTDPVALAARRAVAAGIVVVTSAGNLGLDEQGNPQVGGITSPGNAPWVLTVGAASHQGTAARGDDTLADFSSQGPTWIDFAAKPDVVAYGVGIESLSDPNSTLARTYADYLLDGTRDTPYKPYLSMSGTSMAAPVVAGTVALMLEANPSLTPNAVKAIVEYTAQARGGHTLSEGAGLLNGSGAVRLAQFFAHPQRDLGDMGDTIEGEWIPWSRQFIWGNTRVGGGLILPGSNAWSTRVPWGATATASGAGLVFGARTPDNIVWSTYADDNIVWSTRADNIVWSTRGDDNIVWSTAAADNIVWSTAVRENVVWGADCGGANCARVIWGAPKGDGSTWGSKAQDNIVWSTYADDNIVWSTRGDDNIVWSTAFGPGAARATAADDHIIWGTYSDDNIVWSTGTAHQTRRPATRIGLNLPFTR